MLELESNQEPRIQTAGARAEVHVHDLGGVFGSLALRAVEAAVEHAARADRASIARVVAPLPALPSLRSLTRDPALPGLTFAWREPERARTVLALGALVPPAAQGSLELGARAHDVLGQLAPIVGASPGWQPALGLAWTFLPLERDALLGGVWARWPLATLAVAELSFIAEGTDAWAEARAIVRPGLGSREREAVAGRLAERLTAAHVAAERAHRAPLALGIIERPLEFAAAPSARDEFEARVALARSALVGPLEKLVLARSAAVPAPGGARFDAAAVFDRLVEREPRAFVFAVPGPDRAVFVGATPELLVERRGADLRSVSLAGTRARGAGQADDVRALVNSLKDRHEQALVTEDLAARLASLAGGRAVERSGPEIRETRRVLHLETRLHVHAPRTVDLVEAARALHPSPAVAGLPRASALSWLEAHEALDRGYYAGPVGFLDANGDGLAAVALRSALVSPEQAIAFAGAGIVPASDPAAEWRETEHKLEVILDALRGAIEPQDEVRA